MDGMILIDKPQSFTSFDVVAVMRGLFHPGVAQLAAALQSSFRK